MTDMMTPGEREDRDAAARELSAKAQAAHIFILDGFNPKSVIKAMGLPEMEFNDSLDAGDVVEVHDGEHRKHGVVKHLGNATAPLCVVIEGSSTSED